MRKQKGNRKPGLSRIGRIERKCDRILSELLVIRHRISSSGSDMDSAIERMHRAARMMRRQCEREYDACCKIIKS